MGNDQVPYSPTYYLLDDNTCFGNPRDFLHGRVAANRYYADGYRFSRS